MNLYNILKSITRHPLTRYTKIRTILRFFKWQINARINPYSIIYPFTEKSKLIIRKGMTGATGNLYCGLKDFEDMGFLLHFLRSEDCFVDVGANIGSYTILASAHVGAETIAFEPSPRTFKNLMDNIYINNCNRKVSAYQTSLGACDGSIGMTFAIDAMNNHIAQTEDLSSISVKMVSLDEMLLNHNVPTLIKIDVEGYETEVLKGAQQTLKDRGLNAIIIELMGLGKRYGFNEHDIHEMLISHGFFPYNYDPLQRELITIDSFGPRNTIYIRDLEFVYKRLKSAEKITILGIEF